MIRTLLRLVPSGSRGAIAGHLALTVLGVALRAAGVVLLVPVLGALFGPHPADAWPWIGALAAATVLGWVVDALVSRLGFELGFALLGGAQHRVADALLAARLSWFTADSTATARSAVAAAGPELAGLMIYLVTPLLNAVLLPIAIALALLPVSPLIAGAALAGVPVLLLAFWASGRLSRAADRAAEASNERLTERILEFARTQEALRAARRVAPARSRAGEALAAQHGATTRLLLMQVPGQILFSAATQVALVVLAGAVVLSALNGTIGPAEAVALIVVAVRYLEPFSALGELAPALESAGTLLGRFRAVLDAPPARSGEREQAPDAAPRIELRGVRFGYPDADGGVGDPVLDGIDLVLEPGTTTAIVGPSGSGKSTVLSLIAGLRAPDEGRVLVDGADADDWRPGARPVSMVFQQPALFDGSIRDNVRAGRPGAPEEDERRACALARVDEIVDRLPDGLGSRVGEGGVSLSGGERQRVAIARALLSAAPVLLVDEATSALDTENEAAVVAALRADPTPRTRVIVAHRLASVRAADRVVFLEEGRIVEDGGVDELLAAGGRFSRFWSAQEEAAHWRLGPRG